MTDCHHVESLVTPYVDRELDIVAAGEVEGHIETCTSCASRIAVEQSVRALLRERRSALCRERASVELRARCETLRQSRVAPMRPLWRGDFARYALAASLLMFLGGAFLYQATGRSARVMAAELTADHVKCFVIGPSGKGEEGAARVLVSHFDWHVQLPQGAERIGLELVGARLCIYGRGRVAHIMYRHRGRPVSVFMLPHTMRATGLVDVLGHEAAIWTADNRTFVLIAQEPRTDVDEMAAFVRAGLR